MGTAIAAILVFSALVFFHELGHFTLAKLVGIKVHEFAIGMGPKLASVTGGGTSYSLRLLPIGGYVKMEGEDEHSEEVGSFTKKPVWARMAVIVAGPLMNFVLGLGLLTFLFYQVGTVVPGVARVLPQTPAEAMELEPGDRVIAIDGQPIDTWTQLEQTIMDSEGRALTFEIRREDQVIEKIITPMWSDESAKFMIGIEPLRERSLSGAFSGGLEYLKLMVGEIFNFLRKLVTWQASTEEVVGPVGIIGLVGEATRSGWLDVVFLAAIISINLGLMNLLPIPALDGSRLLFLLFEFFRGKPVDPEREGMIHMIGFSLLIAMMVFVTYQDILRIFN